MLSVFKSALKVERISVGLPRDDQPVYSLPSDPNKHNTHSDGNPKVHHTVWVIEYEIAQVTSLHVDEHGNVCEQYWYKYAVMKYEKSVCDTMWLVVILWYVWDYFMYLISQKHYYECIDDLSMMKNDHTQVGHAHTSYLPHYIIQCTQHIILCLGIPCTVRQCILQHWLQLLHMTSPPTHIACSN